MRTASAVVGTVLVLASALGAIAPPLRVAREPLQAQTAEQELRVLNEGWSKALIARDHGWFERHIADEYLATDPDGVPLDETRVAGQPEIRRHRRRPTRHGRDQNPGIRERWRRVRAEHSHESSQREHDRAVALHARVGEAERSLGVRRCAYVEGRQRPDRRASHRSPVRSCRLPHHPPALARVCREQLSLAAVAIDMLMCELEARHNLDGPVTCRYSARSGEWRSRRPVNRWRLIVTDRHGGAVFARSGPA